MKQSTRKIFGLKTEIKRVQTEGKVIQTEREIMKERKLKTPKSNNWNIHTWYTNRVIKV